MKVELSREDLKALVRGNGPYYSAFNHPLVKKAGHRFAEQYSRTSWDSLDKLTDQELLDLYKICKESWN
jgi:hypothetical protein